MDSKTKRMAKFAAQHEQAGEWKKAVELWRSLAAGEPDKAHRQWFEHRAAYCDRGIDRRWKK